MKFSEELLDDLLKNYEQPEDLIGKNGLLKQLTKALFDRALEAEMSHHLGYKKHHPDGYNSGNSRNGKNNKQLQGEEGAVDIVMPRDRNGTFSPKIIKKGQTKFDGFDEKIISLYARGMTIREIQGYLKELYGTEISPDFISSITDAVVEEMQAWQHRPLDPLYPIVYLDGLVVKVRDGGHVMNKTVYLVIGVNMEGHKEILGLWIAQTEGAKFWLQIITDLKNRGVQDILIACIDGLKGFPEAIHSIFPTTQIQLCIVHLVRRSLRYVPWQDRKAVARDLKLIYTSTNLDTAEGALAEFKSKWDNKYPMISDVWSRNWEGIIPFLAYPDYIRKAIYTTNAIESTNNGIRKILKTRRSFPTDEAVIKLIFLALKNISQKWTMPIRQWKLALNQFAIIFGDRMEKYI